MKFLPGVTGSQKRRSGGVVAGVGVVLVGLPLVDMYQDVTVAGHAVGTTVVESAVPLLVALALVAAGAWLAAGDRSTTYVARTAKWTVSLTAAVALAVGWIVVYQATIIGALKPVTLAANTVIFASSIGLLVGLYNGSVAEKQEALRAERDRFSALFENVPNSVVAIRFDDEEPIVDAVNPAFESVFGFDESTIRGRNLNEFVVPVTADGRAVEPSEDTTVDVERERGEWKGNEVTLQTEDGLREFLRMTAPVESGARQSKYGIYIDITERKQRKERLDVLNRILRHNLRNKIGVVEGHAGLLASSVDGDDREHVAAIEEAAADLAATSRQTLDVENHLSQSVGSRTFDLEAVATEAMDAVASRHGEDWTADVRVESTASVQGTDALPAAVEELVENAVVHSDREHPTVQVVVRDGSNHGFAELIVRDDGPGLPDRNWGRRVGETGLSKVEHAEGVGLWAVNWIVSDAGGEVDFLDEPGRGTAVALQLKHADDE